MPGLKAITANTDPAAKAHVYAEDDAAIFQSIVGADGVFDIGQKCAATILSNNQVRVEDGVVCIGGHFARIPYGDYADCSIANGQSGYNRNDIIVAKIVSTGFGGIDTMTCEVKQGEAGATASDPVITKGNMYAGELEREFPLYRVRIEGISIAGIDKLFNVIPTIPQTEERIKELEVKVDGLNSKITHTVTAINEQTTIKRQDCCEKNGVIYCHIRVTIPVIGYPGAWLLQTPVRPLGETVIHGVGANGIVRRFYINIQGILGNEDNIDVSGDYDISFVISNA